jgi:hypothetical protein
MDGFQIQTPVAFFVFNRPSTTSRVFEEIRRARPPKLLLVADGPRPDRLGEAEKCDASRAIVEKVDWPCQVERNYAETNMGCGRRIASGITWVFGQVEEAIILEDDCLPDPSFFTFCETLLEFYRHDTRVMHIGGNNFQSGIKRGSYSYFFSKYSHIWGWATWRRAWKHFDPSLATWPAMRKSDEHLQLFDNEEECIYWSAIFDQMVSPQPIDTWDYCWTYACFMQGLSVYPNVNLVSNVGFNSDATHTVNKSSIAELPAFHIGEINHPPYVIRNCQADRFTFEQVFRGPLRLNKRKLKHSLLRYLKRMLDKHCSGGSFS